MRARILSTTLSLLLLVPGAAYASAGIGSHAFRSSGRGFHAPGRGFGGRHLFFFGGGGGGSLLIILVVLLVLWFVSRNRRNS